jgi:hypothetical protein
MLVAKDAYCSGGVQDMVNVWESEVRRRHSKKLYLGTFLHTARKALSSALRSNSKMSNAVSGDQEEETYHF